MRIQVNTSTFHDTKWYEYLIRFLFGGVATAIAGIIAKEFGPVLGGLFLAFPAIFPASATLVEKHERRRKERQGLNGVTRGRKAAGIAAAGAAMGSIGLAGFGAMVWWLASRLSVWLLLIAATLAWGSVSGAAWLIRNKICKWFRARINRSPKNVDG